jgi:hypothetical protein
MAGSGVPAGGAVGERSGPLFGLYGAGRVRGADADGPAN